ncbi:hypothetical protein [Cupriavidus metallidurans]|uniref:Uncharacterized protein n=2 Tax=Cupriavidus TaxID=106589 RepID=A0A482J4Q2_9BURK|nr:hypothetical protein [Cupriavidus metallidurans]QBP14399.1 hypothetical protein DDF84_032270 [Cupriavidus metallidurans]
MPPAELADAGVSHTVPPRKRLKNQRKMTTNRKSGVLARHTAIIASAIVLSACGGGSDSQAQTPPTETPAQAVQRLEQTGQLPILDRSPDVKGPDANGNGIRDDIETYISKQPYDAGQRAAVEQLAKSLQATLLVDVSNNEALRAVDQQANRAIHCIWSRFTTTAAASGAVTMYEKLTANTEFRARAYLAYSKALDGTVSSQPRGDTCDAQ